MSVSAHIVVYILYIHVCISLSALVIQDASVCQPVGQVTQTFGILSVQCFLVSVMPVSVRLYVSLCDGGSDRVRSVYLVSVALESKHNLCTSVCVFVCVCVCACVRACVRALCVCVCVGGGPCF